jgi:hypothetical protein
VEYPKMMYRKHPEFKVAQTAEEAQELEKKGYKFERWPPEEMKEKKNEPNGK